jgi:hypothetical protein
MQARITPLVLCLGLAVQSTASAQYARYQYPQTQYQRGQYPTQQVRPRPTQRPIRILCKCYTGSPARSFSYNELQLGSVNHQQLINSMLSLLGVTRAYTVFAGPVENAVAAMYGEQPIIVYNPQFLEQLSQQTMNRWAAISVLAHELGHHQNLDTAQSAPVGGPYAAELRADFFSGSILRRLGARQTDATIAMQTSGSDTGTSSHPDKYRRIQEIIKGYSSGTQNPRGGIDRQPVEDPDTAPAPDTIEPMGPPPTADPTFPTYPNTGPQYPDLTGPVGRPQYPVSPAPPMYPDMRQVPRQYPVSPAPPIYPDMRQVPRQYPVPSAPPMYPDMRQVPRQYPVAPTPPMYPDMRQVPRQYPSGPSFPGVGPVFRPMSPPVSMRAPGFGLPHPFPPPAAPPPPVYFPRF